MTENSFPSSTVSSSKPWKADRLWWIITGNCNLKCKHCYLEAPTKRYRELSLKECLLVVEQCKEAGIKDVFLTGGEPFVRTDLFDVIGGIREAGLSLGGIETNGTLITSALIHAMRDWKCVFHVSWDGVGYGKRFRGANFRDEKIARCIGLLKERGCSVLINTILNSKNAINVLRMPSLLSNLGVDEWRIFVPARIGRWKQVGSGISPDDEARAYIRVLEAWLEEGRPFDLALGSLLTGRRENDGNLRSPKYACEYFRSTVTLLPDGTLLPCCRYIAIPAITKQAENAFKRAIESQLRGSIVRTVKSLKIRDVLSLDSNRECRDCSVMPPCDLGCRVDAYLETGSLLNRSMRHCYLMKKYYWEHFYDYDYRHNRQGGSP